MIAGHVFGRRWVVDRIPATLLAALADLVKWLDTAKIPSMVIGGLRVRLSRVEDLLIMKAVARRPKDLQDIAGLLAAHPEADVAAVRQWVSEFATAMSMSDMLDDFDKLVERNKSARSS